MQSAQTATLVARIPIVFFFMARSSMLFNYYLRRQFLDAAAHYFYFSAIVAPQQKASWPSKSRQTSLYLRQWKNRWLPLLGARRKKSCSGYVDAIGSP
jgi:hypothetical protein